MFVAVYPPAPSSGLTAALLGAGFQPVPVDDVAQVGSREPEQGWVAAVVELGEDVGLGALVGRKIREEHDVGVLLVADRTVTADLGELEGFDDFVLTPIDVTELRVRLRRIGSTAVMDSAGEEVLRFGDLELNTSTYQASIGSRPIDLTYMEYELLRFFVEHPNRVWSREQILSKVWGYDYFGGSRTVDVHVRRLRAKLGESRASWITTVRSVGYRFG